MSITNTFTLDLDLKNNNYISEPVVTSNDSVRFIINLTDDALPLDLTDVVTVSITHTRPDGVVVVKSGSKDSGNQVSFDFGSTETAVPGRVDAKVQLYDADDRISTLYFGYTVTKDPTGDDYIPSENEKTLIEEVLENGPQVIEGAQQAITDANAAADNANTAADTANTAASNADTATDNANDATTAANTATTNANNAADNANDAAENATTAQAQIEANESERQDNEAAREAAEAIRITNETSRQSNEGARTTAETARANAESTRVSSETARDNAEDDRASAENLRDDNEVARQSNESSRQSAESTRVSAESGRVSAESTRVSNESARVTAETARATAETSRASAESTRVSNESARVTAETARDTAETSRVSAETSRDNAEDDRVTAENARETAETARDDAEDSREASETTRQNLEAGRVSAETDRATAESARVTAETARASAESTRQTQEAARQTNTAQVIDDANDKINELDTLIQNTTGQNEYNPATTYQKNNFVTYNGSSYMALTTVTGVTPGPAVAQWQLMAQRGVDGEGSVSSVNGKSPDLAGNVALVVGDIPGAASETDMEALEELLEEGQTIPSPIVRGSNVITTTQASGATTDITGVTLSNILGRLGDGESLTGWTAAGNGTSSVSTTQKVSGLSSFKFEAIGAQNPTRYADMKYVLEPTKYWLVVFKVFIESRVGGTPRVVLCDYGSNSGKYAIDANVSTTGTWQTISYKIPVSNTLVGGFRIFIGMSAGATDMVAYFDDIRIYELSASDYAAIGTTILGVDAIDRRWPYVDSVQHLQGVSLAVPGKNLLPMRFNSGAITVVSATEFDLTSSIVNGSAYQTIDVVPNTDYVFSADCGATGQIHVVDTDGTTTLASSWSNLPRTFNSGNRTKVRVYFRNTVVGTVRFTNPQLEVGSVVTNFQPYSPQYAHVPTKLASNVDRTIADSYDSETGEVFRRWETGVKLDGSLAWAIVIDGEGFKRISATSTYGKVGSGYFTTRDGQIFKYSDPPTAGNQFFFHGGNQALHVTINDVDSGWTEAINPNANAIKALMNGWKAAGNNGTIYNSWTSILTGAAPATNTEAYVAANKAPGWEYYATLDYVRATPIVEQLTGDLGGLSVVEGGNVVELVEGVVLRENATPKLDGTHHYIMSKDDLSFWGTSRLQHNIGKVLVVYKNSIPDNKWGPVSGSIGASVRIPASDFDSTAEYSIDYMISDKYLYTPNVIDATLVYQSTLGGAVSQATQDIAALKTHDGVQDFALDYIQATVENVSLDLSEFESNLGTASQFDAGNSVGQVPIVQSDGKLHQSIMPNITITDTFVVASQATMLALTAQIGDVAVRTDLNKSFILRTFPSTTLSNWQELLSPTDTVLSVAGKTGVVSLTGSDISATGGTTVQAEIDGLKSSVSDGKTLIASAITDKGVPTEATDSFATMANNVDSIPVGSIPGYKWRTIPTPSPLNNSWSDIAYGNGVHVMVGSSSAARIARSIDGGETWTPQTSGVPSNGFSTVCYGKGLFVAGANSGTTDRLITSPDGITWTARTIPQQIGFYKIIYANGVFIALGLTVNGVSMMRSENGTHWMSVTNPVSYTWSEITYGKGLFVAITTTAGSGNLNRILTSPDGITWTLREAPTSTNWNQIEYGNGIFIATANNSGDSGDQFMFSNNGVNWTSMSRPFSTYPAVLVFGGGRFMAAFNNSPTIALSEDGTSWETVTTTGLPSNQWKNAVYAEGKFVMISNSGTNNRVVISDAGESISPFFKIVDEGMEVLSDAISSKDVPTTKNDSLQTMADNVSSLQTKARYFNLPSGTTTGTGTSHVIRTYTFPDISEVVPSSYLAFVILNGGITASGNDGSGGFFMVNIPILTAVTEGSGTGANTIVNEFGLNGRSFKVSFVFDAQNSQMVIEIEDTYNLAEMSVSFMFDSIQIMPFNW